MCSERVANGGLQACTKNVDMMKLGTKLKVRNSANAKDSSQ